MPPWEFVERLPALRANLKVGPKTWIIECYFPGPDMRYNGEFLKIEESYAPKLKDNLIKTWGKFLEAQQKFDGEKQVELAGFGSSRIYIKHVFGSGITLHGRNGLIDSERLLNFAIKELDDAPRRAAVVQQKLIGL